MSIPSNSKLLHSWLCITSQIYEPWNLTTACFLHVEPNLSKWLDPIIHSGISTPPCAAHLDWTKGDQQGPVSTRYRGGNGEIPAIDGKYEINNTRSHKQEINTSQQIRRNTFVLMQKRQSSDTEDLKMPKHERDIARRRIYTSRRNSMSSIRQRPMQLCKKHITVPNYCSKYATHTHTHTYSASKQ